MFSTLVSLSFLFVGGWCYAPLRQPGAYNEAALLEDALEQINFGGDGTFFDLGSKRINAFGSILPGRAKESEFLDEGDYDVLLGPSGNPSIRDHEYLQHSALYGHKFNGGDAFQKIKGGQEEKELKTDSVLPAYCNPPNPCPVGFTAEDGCLEIFENTASFSRSFQASQDCMCDSEHMFDCPRPRDSEASMESPSFMKELQVGLEGEHKSLVAKKFSNTKSRDGEEERVNELARAAALLYGEEARPNENPYLQGEQLPIQSKKGHF